MKKFTFVYFLVLGLFFFYSAFGASLSAMQVPSAHADDRNGGDSRTNAQDNSGTSTEVHSQGDENVNDSSSSDSEDMEIEVEHEDQNVRSTSSLEKSIENRQNELDTEIASSTDDNEQEALKDHDQTRLAVHTLLSSKNLLGGIGPEVSALAQDLNSSVTSTVSEEAKIQSRGWLTRLFFGGDQQNSASLAGQVNQNLENIQKLQTLITNCTSCSADLKTMLQNQLKLAQDEQTHLEALAKDQADSRGIFGAILRLFGR